MGLAPVEEAYFCGGLKGSYSSDKHYYVNLNTCFGGACDVYSYCMEDDGFDYQPTHGASPGVCDDLTAPSVSNRSG